MVDLDSRLNSFRVNRVSKLDFPTPESPMRTTKSGIHDRKKRKRDKVNEKAVVTSS